MNKTGIEWCTASWNCLRGCSPASTGCDRCYAEAIAKRFGKPGQVFHGTYDYRVKGWSGALFFQAHKLDEPRKMKTPQLIFANSMSDICHPAVKPEWIDAMFYAMTAAEQHFYLMLTKRPNLIDKKFFTETREDGHKRFHSTRYSWPNRLAVGTSIESGQFRWRANRLLEQWPGECFLSIEPLIEGFSIKDVLWLDHEQFGGRIKQVIVGGETGHDARPMHPDWVRQLRDETLDAGRSFFFKQWGDVMRIKAQQKIIGRTLDGRQWNESPWPV